MTIAAKGTDLSFLDKVKASVKSGAEQAATRAQEEIDRRQAKRELQQAYADLGEKAFELAERGELTTVALTAPVDRVRAARTQLDAIGSETQAAPPEPSDPAPTEAPPPG